MLQVLWSFFSSSNKMDGWAVKSSMDMGAKRRKEGEQDLGGDVLFDSNEYQLASHSRRIIVRQ